jgi:DNA-directed RNA polymerase subunit RPC12/RpoP
MMECPRCKYKKDILEEEEEGYEEERIKENFYALSNSIVAVQDGAFGERDNIEAVYACPSCGSLFIEV